MKKSVIQGATAGVLAIVIGIGLLSPAKNPVHAQEVVPWAAPIMKAGEDFADALTQANRARVESVVCAPLWARLAPNFTGSPSPGAFGEYELVESGGLLKEGVARLDLLCKHPDGVEDVVFITLRKVNGKWKVCGGPAGMSNPNPLK